VPVRATRPGPDPSNLRRHNTFASRPRGLPGRDCPIGSPATVPSMPQSPAAGAGSGGAGDFDQEAPPAGRVGPGDPERSRPGSPAPDHPGGQPAFDLGRQVPDGVSAGQVDPDSGFIVEGWVGDEEEFVDRKSTRLNSSHVKISY